MEAVLAIDPEHSFSLQPRDGVTLCNEAVRFMLAVLGGHIPRAVANEQADWLDSAEARAHGWMRCDSSTLAPAEVAKQRAELGYPTVAVYRNPSGHGHIALCIPAPDVDEGHLYVAAAGEVCTNSARIEKQFGNLPVAFFTCQ